MSKKDIVLSIILTVITCGIYGIIWYIQMTDDTRIIAEDNNMSTGIMVLILTIITCGFYKFYWSYNMGKKLYEAGVKKNINVADNSVAYLIISLLNFDIINYALIQTDINRIIDNAN